MKIKIAVTGHQASDWLPPAFAISRLRGAVLREEPNRARPRTPAKCTGKAFPSRRHFRWSGWIYEYNQSRGAKAKARPTSKLHAGQLFGRMDV